MLPAGPMPLMPNRLWSVVASVLCPQPDSSMAWAIVTEAGTPYLRCAAMAPGATRLMKACWLLLLCAGAGAGAGLCRLYCVAEGAFGAADSRCAMIGSPGITAVSARAPVGSAAKLGAAATGKTAGASEPAPAGAWDPAPSARCFGCWAAATALLPGTTLSATVGSEPLLTNPCTACPASGPGYSCELTEKLGRESPPMVDRTPPEYLVTTSTWPSNTTQSPGSG